MHGILRANRSVTGAENRLIIVLIAEFFLQSLLSQVRCTLRPGFVNRFLFFPITGKIMAFLDYVAANFNGIFCSAATWTERQGV